MHTGTLVGMCLDMCKARQGYEGRVCGHVQRHVYGHVIRRELAVTTTPATESMYIDMCVETRAVIPLGMPQRKIGQLVVDGSKNKKMMGPKTKPTNGPNGRPQLWLDVQSATPV